MNKKYWENGVNQIINRLFNGTRTIKQSREYMDQNFTGDSRKAHNHQMYEATSADITAELTVKNLLTDAIKLGYGDDLNFERVYR